MDASKYKNKIIKYEQNNETQNNKFKHQRIYFLDEFRGFLVICMVFYHAFFTMSNLFNLHVGTNLFAFFMPLEPIFAGLFIIVSGISSQLSNSNIIRGMKLFLISLLVTLVTFLVVPDEIILFGILHMLSICMIIFGLLKPIIKKLNALFGVIICITLFIFTKDLLNLNIIGIGSFSFNIPKYLYEINYLFPFGITNKYFYSSDYFPLIPWAFIFFAGTFLGKILLSKNIPTFALKNYLPYLSWCGRHALIIYLLHQPLIFTFLLIFNLF